MTDIQKTLSDRKEKYGDFRGHAELAIELKNVMRSGDSWYLMNPYMQEALDMIQHKIARILNGDPMYEDSWVDIVGYAQLALDRVKQDNLDRAVVHEFAIPSYSSQTVVESATIVSSTTNDPATW